ncbi:MAG: hypothetical protein AAGH15_04905 [Myxococcota bacterium]
MFSRLFVTSLALAFAALGLAQPAPRPPGGRLSRAAVRADIAVLERALDEVYAGRSLVPDARWRHFVGGLDGISVRRLSPEPFCRALAREVDGQPRIRLFVAGPGTFGAPCHRTRDLAPSNRAVVVANVAENSERAYALLEEPGPAAVRIALLGIRGFPPSGPRAAGATTSEWEGFEGAVARAARAEAVVVDLRTSRGHDPRPALPLLRRLSGLAELHPLRAIDVRHGRRADEMRAVATERAARAPRDPSAYAPFVGAEPANRRPPVDGFAPHAYVRSLDEPLLFVVVGGSCGPACELVTRTLQTYAGATLVGAVDGGDGLLLADWGDLRLPRSGVRVSMPLSAYLPNPRFQGVGGEDGRWSHARGVGSSGPDGVVAALSLARSLLRQRDRVRDWVRREPPPCASFPAYRSRSAMPEGLRGRLQTGGPSVRRAQGLLLVPPDRALPYLEACPGVTSASVRAADRAGRMTVFTVQVTSIEPLTRLAQSPAVELVSPDTPGSDDVLF